MARRTPEQLAETRAALIQAATELFSKHGFASVQIADITQRAGTGISAFYKQFDDKESLFQIIFEQMFTTMHDAILTARRDMDLRAPLDVILGVQRTYDIAFETLYAHRAIALSVLRSGFAGSARLEGLYWSMCDRVAEDMAADLARGQAAGLLHRLNPRLFAEATLGMIRQLAHRMLMDDEPSPHQAARLCTSFTLGALMLSMPVASVLPFLPYLTATEHPKS